jgi:hypothetical protein
MTGSRKPGAWVSAERRQQTFAEAPETSATRAEPEIPAWIEAQFTSAEMEHGGVRPLPNTLREVILQ